MKLFWTLLLYAMIHAPNCFRVRELIVDTNILKPEFIYAVIPYKPFPWSWIEFNSVFYDQELGKCTSLGQFGIHDVYCPFFFNKKEIYRGDNHER